MRTVKRGKEYYEYLRSDAWRELKLRYLRSGMPKYCLVCKKPYEPSFHFHHKTYKNLGRERLMDIQPACPDCHKGLHDLFKKNGKKNLWAAGKKLKRFKRWQQKQLLKIHGDGICQICGHPQISKGADACSYPHGKVRIWLVNKECPKGRWIWSDRIQDCF